MTSPIFRVRCFATLAVLVLAPMLAGCASVASPVLSVAPVVAASVSASPSVAPVASVAPVVASGKMSDADYLAKLQSYPLFSKATAEAAPAASEKMCELVVGYASLQQAKVGVGVMAAMNKITSADSRSLLLMVTNQYCPDQAAKIEAVVAW